MMPKKCILMVLIFALTAGTSAAEKIDLKLRLKPGQKHSIRMVMDQKISQTVRGQEQKFSQMMAMGMDFEVLAVDANGIASVKNTYQTIQAKMEGPTGSMEYDSTKPDAAADANDPAAQVVTQVFAAMVGQSVVMKVTPQGKIIEVTGFGEMMQRMAEKIAGDDPAKCEEIKEFIKIFLSEDKIEMTGSNMTMGFPDRPVGIGDSWTDKETMSVGFPVEVDNTYTLKERKNGVAIVDISSKIDLGEKGASVDMGPMKMEMKMTGSCDGTCQINEATGWMIRSKMKMQSSGQLSIPASEQMPEPMTMPMSIEGLITVEPIEE